jgi:predicted nucleotidyltransferase
LVFYTHTTVSLSLVKIRFVMKSELTAEAILELLRVQQPMLREKFHVQKIGIFGSFARGEATATSDIDFLVTIDAPLENYRQCKEALYAYLKHTFGRNVDLANPKSLKPHYKERILSQAIYA